MPDSNEEMLTLMVAYSATIIEADQRELSAPPSSLAASVGAATNTLLEDAARGA
ncbi:MAG: hypothetical protein Q8N45_07030 [Anaerolineales bacterium]|nr:hypothetical protein [Anaerolineales bacterium]MDP2975952.1 hypothetical protein [Anaerolineales bacterium]